MGRLSPTCVCDDEGDDYDMITYDDDDDDDLI